MNAPPDLTDNSSPRLLEMLARTLRHEVGDLLQTVYSAVAIFQDRLPAEWKLERRVLTDLRGRAEICKYELDAVHDLVCPLTLNYAPVDLAELATAVATVATARYPYLRLHADAAGPLSISADPQKLSQVGMFLMRNACAAARSQVEVRAAASNGEVEWSVTDDGPGVPPEQLAWLSSPFATTHNAQFGLGLALARRVVTLHGGRVAANNQPAGGFRVALTLPVSPPQAGTT